MSVKLEFPDEYMNILHSYAEQNNVTVETALADTLEFLELKNEEFDHYQVTIEDPRQYLNDADDMSAKAIRQAFMDLFGEDSVGDTIYCYYNPDKMDVLLMDIQYDDMVPLWTLLETFHNKIPGMELSGDLLSLFYVRDRFDGRHDEMAELMDSRSTKTTASKPPATTSRSSWIRRMRTRTSRMTSSMTRMPNR